MDPKKTAPDRFFIGLSRSLLPFFPPESRLMIRRANIAVAFGRRWSLQDWRYYSNVTPPLRQSRDNSDISMAENSQTLESISTTPGLVAGFGSYQELLTQYFNTTPFEFRKPEDLEKLKECMSLIFLRQRPLMSIDVEAYEHNPSKITEIGVSLYQHSSSILPSVINIHLLIKENIGLRNGRYVIDNKSRFVGGPSYVLTMEESQKFLNKVVHSYLVDQKGVLVGHGVDSDLRWLRKLKIDVASDISTVDTLKLFHLSKSSGGSLKQALRTLRIPHAYLHNAGNDAYYTLLLAFALCDPSVRTAYQLDTYEQIAPLNREERIQQKRSAMRYPDMANRISCDNGDALYDDIFG